MNIDLDAYPGHGVLCNRLLLGLLMCGAVGLPAATRAEMYKWVDAEGNTQYTQERPPPGIQGEAIKPPPAVDSASALKELEAQEKDLSAVRDARNKQAGELAKAEEDKAFQEENCRRAQASLRAFDVPNALVQQADGSRGRLTEEDRQAGIAKANDAIKEFCK